MKAVLTAMAIASVLGLSGCCICDGRVAESGEEGFVPIFNGKDLSGWEGDTVSYFAADGMLQCHQKGKFGGGNLWTEKSYENYILRFEFKLPPEANNGLAIRYFPWNRASVQGMEIQILDDTAPYYWDRLKLHPYQYAGSIYGVVPAKRKPGFDGPDAPAKSTYLRPLGEWNDEEVRVDGHRVTVILNGETVVNADVLDFRGDGDTPDGLLHPGLHNLCGRIGWCGHGYNVQWRNIRVKELPPSPLEPDGRWAFDTCEGALWFAHGFEPNKDGWSVLWGSGSPMPEKAVENPDGSVVIRRVYANAEHPGWNWERTLTFVPTNAEWMRCSLVVTRGVGAAARTTRTDGFARRIPVLGRPPRLHTLKYEAPVDLLADGMKGWEPKEPDRPFFWTFRDGVLSNVCGVGKDGKRIPGANIVTRRRDFKDFKLTYDVKVPKGCNSGVYLRGVYEIQTLDSAGKDPDCHNMGAVYGRVTPRMSAERDPNEWQHVEVILVNRHITVTLNDQRIIDSAPVIGCTGGAITADEFVPGPIYLQGDHSDASYRNMVLTPIVGELY